ncbi:hypothetical protein [Proteus hauseri]|uniref:hypothetical protein n=1 Tax=Proteus hauseri TaxID=183417 RepID=UPI0032DA576D
MKKHLILISSILSAVFGLISAGLWHLSSTFPNQAVSVVENKYAAGSAIISAIFAYISLIRTSQKTSNIQNGKEQYITRKEYEELNKKIQCMDEQIKLNKPPQEETKEKEEIKEKEKEKEKIF